MLDEHDEKVLLAPLCVALQLQTPSACPRPPPPRAALLTPHGRAAADRAAADRADSGRHDRAPQPGLESLAPAHAVGGGAQSSAVAAPWPPRGAPSSAPRARCSLWRTPRRRRTALSRRTSRCSGRAARTPGSGRAPRRSWRRAWRSKSSWAPLARAGGWAPAWTRRAAEEGSFGSVRRRAEEYMDGRARQSGPSEPRRGPRPLKGHEARSGGTRTRRAALKLTWASPRWPPRAGRR